MLPESLAWLNAEFVQEVLRSSENDDSIRVKNVDTSFATTTGDNFLSDMIRAKVEYSRGNSNSEATQRKSIVIKVAPGSGDAKDITSDLEAFDREMRMMEKTLVEMNKMLEPEKCRLSANVLFTKIGDPTVIAMEDLGTLGYSMADRQIGLDLEHSILVMRALARFHGTSVKLLEKDPNSMAEYHRNPFHAGSEKLAPLFADSYKMVGKEMLKWPELGSSRHIHSEKMSKISDRWLQSYAACTTPNAEEFTVLNHGDCWVNNMLFRYNDEGKVIDHIFVDFQLSSLSSPATDILYFMCSSISDDVEVHHRDELLNEYLSVLTRTMTRLRCTVKPPNIEELKRILKKYEHLEIMSSCVVLPHLLNDRSKAKTLNEILEEGDDYVCPGIADPAYRRKMIRRIPKWIASGALDS